MERTNQDALETLYVLRNDEPIATIETQDRLQWRFAFTPRGIESGIELSNSFSLHDDVIDNTVAKNWFSNLLPEGKRALKKLEQPMLYIARQSKRIHKQLSASSR